MRHPYILNLELDALASHRAEIVVVGAGVAGLSAALAVPENVSVAVLAKDRIEESNTYYAQGGIASALDPGDRVDDHVADTLRAGAGLCDEANVRLLVAEGIERVRELLGWGVAFDREPGGELSFTKEGGHGRRRILHAAGDSTGREIELTLLARVAERPNVRLLPFHFAVELLHEEGEVWGVVAFDKVAKRYIPVEASRAVVLAGGGIGQVYRETTNPEVATGDGMAMAFRAGAELVDMEFVQFHPTTLYLAGAPRFLISEAVRGEGAWLVDASGERFMERYEPKRMELAPRDVVSQSILRFMEDKRLPCVYLDLRHLDPAMVEARFPTIREVVAGYGLDLARDPIPVRPAVHYMMGGVRTNERAETNIDRLYAAGECACTGVHGANRLASNSLLEGLVFGYIAGGRALRRKPRTKGYPRRKLATEAPPRGAAVDVWDLVASLKSAMSRHAGPFRTAEGLTELTRQLRSWHRYIPRGTFRREQEIELFNMATVAGLVARAALRREESRGAHQRLDFPKTNPRLAREHAVLTLDRFRDWE